jgi:GH15 family glucan-1,4-alpha-glucosidase
MKRERYPPISDYGYIADCHSAALISRFGSIDWCCMPRMDSGSCFGRLLDFERGGFCKISPGENCRASRRYVERTMVLETTFQSKSGESRLLDCFTMRKGGEHKPHQQILRVLEGLRGSIDFHAIVAPCFDYGSIRPWIRECSGGHYIAVGGSDGLLISGDIPLTISQRHLLIGNFRIAEGERYRLSIIYGRPEDLEDGYVEIPSSDEQDRRLEATIAWWEKWNDQIDFESSYEQEIRRSAMVLKGLTNAPTGAIAAAPTTSLPESPGGSRNWDYRFSWIRDSCFAVRSLAILGYEREADGFRRFIERSAAGNSEEIQILFGVSGTRRMSEIEIEGMEGYRGARPVRVGNAARTQLQLDVYGELLDLAWKWHDRKHSPDDDYWAFLLELANDAGKRWKDPDKGIWELRDKPRHFVFSKAMCWVALDRGIRLAEDLGRSAPLRQWKRMREEIRKTVEDKGYDGKRGVFIQAFENPKMDASLLLLPMFDFIDYRDKRMLRTTDMICEELEEDGLIRRYAPDDDGLEGREGIFLACSFWLAECLARQGRLERARRFFQRAKYAGNDLGLFSEEYDTRSGEMLGNFPQALTHLSLISAAVALGEVKIKDRS